MMLLDMKLRLTSTVDISTRSFLNDAWPQIQIYCLMPMNLSSFPEE